MSPPFFEVSVSSLQLNEIEVGVTSTKVRSVMPDGTLSAMTWIAGEAINAWPTLLVERIL
jgi:hypothetical protein